MIHLQNLPRLHNDRDAIGFQRCASHLSLCPLPALEDSCEKRASRHSRVNSKRALRTCHDPPPDCEAP
jgi:hypothetical protein